MLYLEYFIKSHIEIVMTSNELIAAIVVALGGTVSNEDNRNSLLNDWLMAVGG